MRRMLEEELLHTAAIGWLDKSRGYDQRFEDREETTKARLDSVGLLAGRAWLIEVKPNVDAARALHIISKFTGSLIGHRDAENRHPLFVAMREFWDGRTTPVLSVIATRFRSDGLARLTEWLTQHAFPYHFDWVLLKWDESMLVTVKCGESGRSGPRDPCLAIAHVETPRSIRKPLPTFDELRLVAQANGVLNLFDRVVLVSKEVGFSLDARASGVTLTRPRGRGWVPIVLKQSTDAAGLVVGFDPSIVPQLPEGLSRTNTNVLLMPFSAFRIPTPLKDA